MLRARRPLTLGYGVASYLLFLIPGFTVFAMPAAVAGAIRLSREVLQLGGRSAAAVAGPDLIQGRTAANHSTTVTSIE